MLDRNELLSSVERASDWITDVAQLHSEGIPSDCARAASMPLKSWKGALRGEYDASTQTWNMFCPIWHTGQAVKALVQAYLLTNNDKYLICAKEGGELLLANQRSDGLILAIEDFNDSVNTSAILEGLAGIKALYELTNDLKYSTAYVRAARWVLDNAYMGDGHMRDNYTLTSQTFTPPGWSTWYAPPEGYPKREGRPLADDAVFLHAYEFSGDTAFKTAFLQITEFLCTHQVPIGTWNNYVPSSGIAGISHPRQSFWWGMPMYEAYQETGDKKYYECLRACGEWYIKAQRHDGGMFRNTDLNFDTPSFGLCTSGIACASLVWMRLYSLDHDRKWIDFTERALRFCMNVQFINAADKNMEGAVLESTCLVPHSDASPYRLRDLASIFFIQAATEYLKLTE